VLEILFYEYIYESYIVLDGLDYAEIVLWIISMVVMAIVGLLFMLDMKKIKNFKYIGFFLFSFIIARVCRLYSKFVIGYEYGDYQFEGALFIAQFLYTTISYFSLFFIFYYGENEILTRSHHFFTILVIIVTVLSILNYIFPILMIILTPLFLFLVLALPSVLIKHGRKVGGRLGTKSLIAAFGIILFIVGVIFDVPEVAPIWMNFPGFPNVLKILAPVLQIMGPIVVRYGFAKKVDD